MSDQPLAAALSDKPTFETSDIRHGSWIMARGKRYLDASDGTGRLTFRFGCSPEEAAGYFGDDNVSARALFQAWKFLRDVIDSHRGGSTTTNRSRATDARAYR